MTTDSTMKAEKKHGRSLHKLNWRRITTRNTATTGSMLKLSRICLLWSVCFTRIRTENKYKFYCTSKWMRLDHSFTTNKTRFDGKRNTPKLLSLGSWNTQWCPDAHKTERGSPSFNRKDWTTIIEKGAYCRIWRKLGGKKPQASEKEDPEKHRQASLLPHRNPNTCSSTVQPHEVPATPPSQVPQKNIRITTGKKWESNGKSIYLCHCPHGETCRFEQIQMIAWPSEVGSSRHEHRSTRAIGTAGLRRA